MAMNNTLASFIEIKDGVSTSQGPLPWPWKGIVSGGAGLSSLSFKQTGLRSHDFRLSLVVVRFAIKTQRCWEQDPGRTF